MEPKYLKGQGLMQRYPEYSLGKNTLFQQRFKDKKNSSLTFHIIPKTLSIGCELRSTFMKLGERSEEGIFSRMTLQFDTHLVRLKPRVLRHEISNKDNLNSLHQKKNLKSHP